MAVEIYCNSFDVSLILHDPYNLACICTFEKAATSFRLYGIPNFKGNLSPKCGDTLNLGSSGTGCQVWWHWVLGDMTSLWLRPMDFTALTTVWSLASTAGGFQWL